MFLDNRWDVEEHRDRFAKVGLEREGWLQVHLQ